MNGRLRVTVVHVTLGNRLCVGLVDVTGGEPKVMCWVAGPPRWIQQLVLPFLFAALLFFLVPAEPGVVLRSEGVFSGIVRRIPDVPCATGDRLGFDEQTEP